MLIHYPHLFLYGHSPVLGAKPGKIGLSIYANVKLLSWQVPIHLIDERQST